MGGLRKATLSEAMEILQDKKLQKYLYFKRKQIFGRVIDYQWKLDHDWDTSLLKQEFYMELRDTNMNDNVDIQTEESLMEDHQTIHININVPKEDILHKDRREVAKGVLNACEYHILKQFNVTKGEK